MLSVLTIMKKINYFSPDSLQTPRASNTMTSFLYSSFFLSGCPKILHLSFLKCVFTLLVTFTLSGEQGNSLCFFAQQQQTTISSLITPSEAVQVEATDRVPSSRNIWPIWSQVSLIWVWNEMSLGSSLIFSFCPQCVKCSHNLEKL